MQSWKYLKWEKNYKVQNLVLGLWKCKKFKYNNERLLLFYLLQVRCQTAVKILHSPLFISKYWEVIADRLIKARQTIQPHIITWSLEACLTNTACGSTTTQWDRHGWILQMLVKSCVLHTWNSVWPVSPFICQHVKEFLSLDGLVWHHATPFQRIYSS